MILTALSVIALSAGAPQTRSAQRPTATMSIQCPQATFEIEKGGSLADVADRYYHDGYSTVAEVRSTPKMLVITWERSMSGIIGHQRLHFRYSIDRQTGVARVQKSDILNGGVPDVIEREDKCKIS